MTQGIEAQKAAIDRLAANVTAGMTLAVPVDYAGVSMAMTWALMRRGVGSLRLLCVPTGGLQVDMLIGAGLVSEVETSAVTLGEAGGAPLFSQALRAGQISIRDATCPAIHAGLMAAQKGVPFVPMRGLLGSDILANRPDWKVIDNPYADAPDPLVSIPALTPDIAIFHCAMADREGNVWIGRRRELAAMAYAARCTLVTVERIVETSLLANEETAAGTLPALYVDDIAEAPNGAWPYGLWGQYPTDTDAMIGYARMMAQQGAEGLAQWLAQYGLEGAA